MSTAVQCFKRCQAGRRRNRLSVLNGYWLSIAVCSSCALQLWGSDWCNQKHTLYGLKSFRVVKLQCMHADLVSVCALRHDTYVYSDAAAVINGSTAAAYAVQAQTQLIG